MTSLIEKRILVYSIPSDLWCTSKRDMLYWPSWIWGMSSVIACATLLQRGRSPTTVFFCKWFWSSDVAKKNGQVRLIFLANHPHAKRTVCYETFFANDSKHLFQRRQWQWLLQTIWIIEMGRTLAKRTMIFFFKNFRYCLQGCQKKCQHNLETFVWEYQRRVSDGKSTDIAEENVNCFSSYC